MSWLSRVLGLTPEPHFVVPVTDATFRDEVVKSELPVLVDVWSQGCGPCKLLEPVVMGLSREFHGRLKVVELDVERAPRTAAALRVTGTPTVLYFRKGKERERVVGFRAAHYHRALIEKELLAR